jgi:tetratricopeptide (TPR) repeat protein
VRWVLISLFVLGVKAQDLTDQIRAAQSSGNYATAAQLYLQLIAAGTDTAEVRSNCGVMLHLAGKNREAMEQFRAALDRNPSLAGANLFAGITELDLGEPKLALPYLKKAQESDPTGPAPLLALGRAYVALSEYALANENYSKAATLDGSLAEAWYGVGVTDRSLAEDLLNRAARNGVKAESSQAKVQGLLDHALKALTRAVELDPNSARTHLIMAEALSDSGKLT